MRETYSSRSFVKVDAKKRRSAVRTRILATIILLVSWCFKPSQSQRIISGPRETFKKRYIVEGTNGTEIRPGEQSEKAESGRENLWNEIQLKGP